MLSRVVRSLRQLAVNFVKSENVGNDALGNRYFKAPHVVDGVESEKRWVQFRGHPDPTELPVEWRSWLANTRPHPPTVEEIERLEAHRRLVKQRAKVLEEEEERRRFQRKSLNQGVQSEGMTPQGFGELIQQIKSTEAGTGSKVRGQEWAENPSYWRPTEEAAK